MVIKIVIIGAGGFGREVNQTIIEYNKINQKYKVQGFIDDDKQKWGKIINKVPTLGGMEWVEQNKDKSIKCIVAIGDPKERKKIVNKIKNKIEFVTLIHPTVIMSEFVEVGEGTIIQAGTIITSNIKIGKHVQINLSSTIGHDTIIENFVTINPGAHINGNVRIEDEVTIGSGVVTKEGIIIKKGTVIGAGAVVIRDTNSNSLYVGNPAILKKKLN